MVKELKLITLVETASFIKESCKLLLEEDLYSLKDALAANPLIGDVMPGLRGLRKVRWYTQQKGKRGGVRVIYFFYNMKMPLFLLNIYSKSDQQDVSAQDKKLLNKLIDELIKNYGENNDRKVN